MTSFQVTENFCEAKQLHFMLQKISAGQKSFSSGCRKFLHDKSPEKEPPNPLKGTLRGQIVKTMNYITQPEPL